MRYRLTYNQKNVNRGILLYIKLGGVLRILMPNLLSGGETPKHHLALIKFWAEEKNGNKEGEKGRRYQQQACYGILTGITPILKSHT